MKYPIGLSALALAALAFSAVAAHAATLTASNGMTLYVFDKDRGTVSACTGLCTIFWPPYMAHTGDKPMPGWSIVKRPSGKLQWAYHRRLVYFYISDRKKGDAKGDGLEGTWHKARK